MPSGVDTGGMTHSEGKAEGGRTEKAGKGQQQAARKRIPREESKLRVKGDLDKARAQGMKKRRAAVRSKGAEPVPNERRKLCTYCGHTRTTSDFLLIKNNAVAARFRYCTTCRTRHPELGDERTDYRSVRAVTAGLPSLGKGGR